MKKTLDWLLEAFMWLYMIFLYSLALPLLLGASVIFVTPLANWLLDHIFIYVPVSVIVGFCLKKWRDKIPENKK